MELFSSWTGSDFLLFYTALLGVAGGAAWWMPQHLRPAGRRGPNLDFEDVAYLVGGSERLADSVLADLVARGALIVADKQKLAVRDQLLFTTPAARSLLALDPVFTPAKAHLAINLHAERILARLRRAGLVMRPEELSRLRWQSVAPIGAVFLLGLYRQRAGSAVGEPTGILVLLLGVTAMLAAIRFAVTDKRTCAGIAVVRELRARNTRAARAPRSDEAAMAVALFGTGVLLGTPWEPVHALRQKDGDSSGSGGGDSDGSGCGGGGCGGCGG